MAVLYLGVAALGAFLVAVPDGLYDPNTPEPGLPGGLLLAVGLVLAIPFAIAPFLPKKPWAWIYHIVLIAVSMSSGCCVFVSVPLLIFWLKPETKAFFGRV